MFVILSGSSGAGKNTIIKFLLEKNKNFKIFKTCSTRGKRPEELENNAYYHLTREEFENKIKNGDFFEFEEIHGNLYGTLNETIDLIRKNDFHYIKDIGVEGQISFKKRLPKDVKIVSIFLKVPKEELIRRLKERGEKEIEKRMERFDYENSLIHNFDYVIENETIDGTIKEIEKIIAEN